MKTIFEEITLGGISVKNRLVRSASLEFVGDADGRFGSQMKDICSELSDGGVGVIITGMIGINQDSRPYADMVKAYEAHFEEDMKSLAAEVHAHGGRLVAQLAHCGAAVGATDDGQSPKTPSHLEGTNFRELSREDLKEIVASFASAAAKCKRAGADGVQLHNAHGFLLAQFLSPVFNQRSDEYGGSIENRSRLLFEIYDAVRAEVGADYPVWLKINATDLDPKGVSLEDCHLVCRKADEKGIDAIEVSGGTFFAPEAMPSQPVHKVEQEAYFLSQAEEISREVRCDVITVGGYRSPSVIEKALNSGNIKAVSLSRPFICEPDLANRWKMGDLSKAKCGSCNGCYGGSPFGCRVFPRS